MSVSMSACLFIHPSKYLFMTVSLLACLFINLSVSLSSCLLALFIYLVLVQYAGLFPCQFFYLSVSLFVCLSVHLLAKRKSFGCLAADFYRRLWIKS
jgi:hypothetical protein